MLGGTVDHHLSFVKNLHGDNLNVLEYFERRLDDHVYVIRSVIIQCEQQSTSEDLIQLLDLLFQDLCNTQRSFASEMRFSCPVEQSTGPGRPRFYIPGEVIRGLHYVHGNWKELAKEEGI